MYQTCFLEVFIGFHYWAGASGKENTMLRGALCRCVTHRVYSGSKEPVPRSLFAREQYQKIEGNIQIGNIYRQSIRHCLAYSPV